VVDIGEGDTPCMASGTAIAAVVALTAMLAACGHSAQQARSQQAQGHSQNGAAAAKASGSAEDADMVAAVSPGGSTPPIAMKFRLAGRPVVGMPVQLVVELIPAADAAIEHIHASFQPGEGLQLQTDRSVDINDPRAGEALLRELTLVPQQPGVLSLTATIEIDLVSGSIARTYSIPVVAGAGAS
jgi:hypothetical protein